jgi:hypothetical protein
MPGRNEDIKVNCELRRDIRRWPAVIFAISRTDSVMGRMILLIVSINTMNIIKAKGVPRGTR